MKERKTNIVKTLLLMLVTAIVSVSAFALLLHLRNQQAVPTFGSLTGVVTLNSQGETYLPLDAAMLLAGYEAQSDRTEAYHKQLSDDLTVSIVFDLDNHICYKNAYTFDISYKVHFINGELYIEQQTLESIVNCQFSQTADMLSAAPVAYKQHEWLTAFPPLIAHAGGGLRGEASNITYANTLEALQQNYSLGHRVFEFDFQLTSDGDLAAVHDGHVDGDESGIFFTAAEWKQYAAAGGTPLLIEDILHQMMINQDMFLVTDTKGTDVAALALIHDKAQALDPALLKRIIPQIYAISMYEPLVQIYPFESIIYTTYASPDSNEGIVDFVSSTEQIAVITTPGTGRIDDGLLELAVANNINVYVHTINDYTQLTSYFSWGVYGLYTDFLLPADCATYQSVHK